MKATDKQEGGRHYRDYAIQPIEYIVANRIGFLAGNVIKYATRYRAKGGAEDIRKAIHYLELILEFEYPEPKRVSAPKTVETPLAPLRETPEWATQACEDYGVKPSTGPALILRLESEDPDQIGELTNEQDRAYQERCDASRPRQEAGHSNHAIGHQEGSSQGAVGRQESQLRPNGETSLQATWR